MYLLTILTGASLLALIAGLLIALCYLGRLVLRAAMLLLDDYDTFQTHLRTRRERRIQQMHAENDHLDDLIAASRPSPTSPGMSGPLAMVDWSGTQRGDQKP